MTTYNAGDRPGEVAVDADAMQQLTEKYTEYRHIIERDLFDPVQAMRLNGEILSSVREVIRSGHLVHRARAGR